MLFLATTHEKHRKYKDFYLKGILINAEEYQVLHTVNPQVPRSSPGRGAKIQKPADESLRAFSLSLTK